MSRKYKIDDLTMENIATLMTDEEIESFVTDDYSYLMSSTER